MNNIPALVQMVAWHRSGDKPLSGPMMAKFNLMTHICVTRPQWTKIKTRIFSTSNPFDLIRAKYCAQTELLHAVVNTSVNLMPLPGSFRDRQSLCGAIWDTDVWTSRYQNYFEYQTVYSSVLNCSQIMCFCDKNKRYEIISGIKWTRKASPRYFFLISW